MTVGLEGGVVGGRKERESGFEEEVLVEEGVVFGLEFGALFGGEGFGGEAVFEVDEFAEVLEEFAGLGLGEVGGFEFGGELILGEDVLAEDAGGFLVAFGVVAFGPDLEGGGVEGLANLLELGLGEFGVGFERGFEGRNIGFERL